MTAKKARFASMEVMALLGEGDWACVYGDAEALVRTCERLAALMEGGDVARLRDVAAWGARDLHIAVRRWAEFATGVRHPGGRSTKREVDGAHGQGDDVSSAVS